MRNVKLEFNLPVSIIKEDKSYVAYTPALDLSTSGKDYEQTKKIMRHISANRPKE